jgi:hypothetical protein
MGDKIDAAGKEEIEKAVATSRKTLESGDDVGLIKTASETPHEVSYAYSAKSTSRPRSAASGRRAAGRTAGRRSGRRAGRRC